jgi:hypothetical protein
MKLPWALPFTEIHFPCSASLISPNRLSPMNTFAPLILFPQQSPLLRI